MKKELFDNLKQKVPVKIWADQVESLALDQLKNMASLPFVFKHIAAMPDVHLGKGATVGSVVATKGAVIPAAVGVDIGCGMMALRLDIDPRLILDNAKDIRQSIERSIPVGHEKNRVLSKNAEDWVGWKNWTNLHATQSKNKTVSELLNTAKLQIGSLGGGNHFIELCTDQDSNIWVMLHSGSRNIGKTLAEMHISNAKAEMKRLMISLPDMDLAYYVEGTPDYQKYIYDLMWAQNYAVANREEMMSRILKDISHAVGLNGAPIPTSGKVNCHHNYAALENHYGENVLVTRKGAVRAQVGDFGIIPGSMGTRSYIVKALGNPESFNSCSHGAGRRMSRTEAKRRFTVDDLKKQTEGVDCRKDSDIVDEIPGAYKDIDEVMENQKDLVQIVAKLKQFICIKG